MLRVIIAATTWILAKLLTFWHQLRYWVAKLSRGIQRLNPTGSTLHLCKNNLTKSAPQSQIIKQIVDSSGKNVTSRSDIANTFNKYFVNVGKNLASKIPPRVNTILSDRVGPSFRLFNTSVVEVSNLINDLNPKKVIVL